MNISRKVAFLSALAFAFLVTLTTSPAALAQTTLQVYNATGTFVDVWWNCTSPPPSAITVKVGGAPVKVNLSRDTGKGFFTLSAGQTATIERTGGGSIVSAAMTFDSIPTCPCGIDGSPGCPQFGDGFRLPTKLPNGVNQAECTLNTGGNESVDISCVNGANSKIVMQLAGGSPAWSVGSITNKRIDIAAGTDQNCTQRGVYPFNYTQCSSKSINTCLNGIFLCTATNGPDFCEVGRAGSGGTVTVVIEGFDF